MNERKESHPERKQGEHGQVLAWVVVLLPLLLVLLGLVFDGGLLWTRFRRARWAADGAAVAAASEMDPLVFQREGRVELTEEAISTATYYADRNYPGLHVVNVYVQDDVVYVRARARAETVFLRLVGVDGLDIHVLGRERPAWGASREEQ